VCVGADGMPDMVRAILRIELGHHDLREGLSRAAGELQRAVRCVRGKSELTRIPYSELLRAVVPEAAQDLP